MSTRRAARPGSVDALAAVLREAHGAGHVVDVRGLGSRGPLGAKGAPPDVALELAALDEVVAYEPADMTLTVQAGARLSDLPALLGEHGQWLPAQAYRTTGSVGGLLASGTRGALALACGAPRDVLIGARFTLADGRVARARGRVVKNVAGYDLPRLLCGSLGSLAVIVEASLRLHPRPPTRCTAVVACADLTDALAVEAALRAARLEPALLDVVLDADGARVLLGLDGHAERVGGLFERARAAVSALASRSTPAGPRPAREPARRDGAASDALRRRLDDAQAWLPDASPAAPLGVLAELRALPSSIPALARALHRVAADLGERPALHARPSLGELRLGTRVAGDATARRLVQVWRLTCAAHVERCGPRARTPALVLLHAPASVRAFPELVFGAPGGGHALALDLRAALDPRRVLGRGRGVGGL